MLRRIIRRLGVESPAGRRWHDHLLLFLLLLGCALPLANNSADPDFWGHVQYGRDLLRDGFPTTATYTYTAEGYTWINHENIAEIVFAAAVDSLGVWSLLVGKCLAGVWVVWLLLGHALRRGAGLWTSSVLALLVAHGLMNYWSVRPQVFSYVGFALMLEILSRGFAAWEGGEATATNSPRQPSERFEKLPAIDGRWLALLVPLFLVWTNSHGGFLAGVMTLTAYLGCRSLEAFWRGGWQAWPTVARLAAVWGATSLTTLLNPYGVGLLTKLYSKLSVPRPEIREWHPPRLDDPHLAPLWLLVAATVASVLLSRRRRDWTHLAVLAATLWQTLEHSRHAAFFAVAVGWLLPEHFDSLLSRAGDLLRRMRLRRSSAVHDAAGNTTGDAASTGDWATRGWLTASALVGVALLAAALGAKLCSTLAEMPVNRGEFPVAAVEFLSEHRLQGKMVACFDWSQYVIAAAGAKEAGRPGIRVQFDGRFRTCYPQEMLDLHFDFILGMDEPALRYRSPKSPECQASRVLSYGEPDLVLIDRNLGSAVRTLRENSHAWTLLYQDGLAQLWGRADKYDQPGGPDYLPPESRRIGNQPQTGYAAWPALPPKAADRQVASAAVD